KKVTSRAVEVTVASGEVMKHAPSGVLRGFTTAVAHVRCRRACRRTLGRALVGVPIAGALPTMLLGLGLHVNLPTSAPRGLYRRHGSASSGGVASACEWPQAAALRPACAHRSNG